MDWIELPAEDHRGNRTALRLAPAKRGIKALAPAANVTHVVGQHVDTLLEHVQQLTHTAESASSSRPRQQ